MVIRAQARLISEVDPRALGFRPALDLRVDLLLPLIDRLSVLLSSPAQRALQTETKLAQNAPDRDIRDAHATLKAQQIAHDRSPPQREGKLELARIAAADGARQPAQIVGSKFRRPSRLVLR